MALYTGRQDLRCWKPARKYGQPRVAAIPARLLLPQPVNCRPDMLFIPLGRCGRAVLKTNRNYWPVATGIAWNWRLKTDLKPLLSPTSAPGFMGTPKIKQLKLPLKP